MFKKKKELSLGDSGELIAKKFLEKKKLKFIEQNYHSKWGEIDLIFYDKKREEFVFVEVKTRKSDFFGTAVESITKTKLIKIKKTVQDFFYKKIKEDKTPYYRIDAVCIDYENNLPVIEHYEDLEV